MVVEARLRIRHRGCITETLTGEAHAAQISGDQQAIFVMHGTSEEQVQAFIEGSCDSIDSGVVVSRSAMSVVLRGKNPPTGIVATILAFGCSILWPAVYSDGRELYTVIAPSRQRLDALVDRLGEMGEVKLEKLADVSPNALDVSVPLADITSGMTERQLTALRRAIEAGYYESPRRTSTEALAKAFGVSRSTLEEHLRKAEQRVLERFAGVLATHPILAKAANAKPGRPRRDASASPARGARVTRE